MSQRGVLYLAKELLSARANSFSYNKSCIVRLNLVAVGGVNPIAVDGGDTTAHELRQRARRTSVASRVTARSRSFTGVTQVVGDYASLMLRWMVQGLG